MTEQATSNSLPLTVALEDVQAALQACMEDQPPMEHVLSRDASLLTDVFATMRYFEATMQSFDELDEKHRAALMRWLPTPGVPHGL